MAYFELIVGALTAVAFATSIWSFLISFVWRPFLIARRIREQGVKGPKSNFWSGCLEEMSLLKAAKRGEVMDINSNDYHAMVFPHYVKWISLYGEIFTYSIGREQRLFISDPELVKEVLSNKFGYFKKPDLPASLNSLLGKGLVNIGGEQWAKHRRIINPAFTMDKIKAMTRTMSDCAESMLDKWDGKEELEVCSLIEEVTFDVISHTLFGSSYSEGKQVFYTQKQLLWIVMATFLKFQLPINKYLPTKTNKHRWKLENKLRDILTSIIKKRLEFTESGYGNDLLGFMLENRMTSEKGEPNLSMDEIIDECKTLFFGGHETTSSLLSWIMFLLSTHQNWQEKLREEVLSVCGMEIPDPEKMSKLKLMTMIIYETLRLYSPAQMMSRVACIDTKLGNLMIPKGMKITIPVTFVHHSKELWGPDAKEFNPLRFRDGASKAAKHTNAMLAFSSGPRACLGQNYAVLEAKIVLTMILQRFSFTISPNYKHMPAFMLTLQPQKGIPIILKLLRPKEN